MAGNQHHLTLQELKRRAKVKGIRNFSTMKRPELIQQIFGSVLDMIVAIENEKIEKYEEERRQQEAEILRGIQAEQERKRLRDEKLAERERVCGPGHDKLLDYIEDVMTAKIDDMAKSLSEDIKHVFDDLGNRIDQVSNDVDNACRCRCGM